MRLVNSHGHVNADRFDDDVDAVLATALEAGVERILVPGWNLRASERALQLVADRPWLDAAVGVHPHDAAGADAAGWATIVAWAADERVVAIGETGLDSDRMFSPWDAQLLNLRRNLALALATGKPAILHCRSRAGERDAQDALVRELRAAGFGGDASRGAFGDRPPAVIHSFSGPVDYAREVLDLGLAISFSGLVFRRGEEASADVAPLVPEGRLLDGDRLAVPLAPGRPARPQRAALRRDHRALARGPARSGGGRARRRPRGRVRRHVPALDATPDAVTEPGRSPRGRLGSLLVDPAPLRLDREYRLLWAGQAISVAGRMITAVVLPYQVYVLTHDVLAVGALSLVQLVPILAFSLGGGAVADAVDRRRLLLVTQVALAFVTLGLAAVSLLPVPPLWAVYALAFAAAGLGSVDQPARASAIPRLVPRERLQSAIALNQLVFNAGAVIGPAIGGIVVATTGIAAAYAVDALSYGAAITTLLFMAPIPPSPGAVRPSITAIADGLRFAWRRRPVLATFVVDLMAMVFGSPRSLFPAMALDVFGVGPAGVGLLSSATALGAMVAALFAGWTTRVRHQGRAVLIAVTIWGLGIAGFGLFTFSFPLALLCLAIAAGADVISAVLRSFIVQTLTPDALRGRVSSIHVLVVTGGPRIGDAEAAAVAAITSPAVSVVTGGLLTVLGAAVLALVLPEFRHLEVRTTPEGEVADDASAGGAAAG